jgi:hypothetical protein
MKLGNVLLNVVYFGVVYLVTLEWCVFIITHKVKLVGEEVVEWYTFFFLFVFICNWIKKDKNRE